MRLTGITRVLSPFSKIYQDGVGTSKRFAYDKVFTPSDTNEDVYNELIAPRIASVVQASELDEIQSDFAQKFQETTRQANDKRYHFFIVQRVRTDTA